MQLASQETDNALTPFAMSPSGREPGGRNASCTHRWSGSSRPSVSVWEAISLSDNRDRKLSVGQAKSPKCEHWECKHCHNRLPHRAFGNTGVHLRLTTWVWRAMDTRIGKRVYWSGSVLILDVSRLVMVLYSAHAVSWLLQVGLVPRRSRLGAGPMMADCVVLPGTHVGYQHATDTTLITLPVLTSVPKIVWSCIFTEGPKKGDTFTPLKRKSGLFIISFVGTWFIGALTVHYL